MPAFPNGPSPWGGATVLNISAPAVVTGQPAVAVLAQVLTAGSAAGAIYDAKSTSGNSASNQVAVLPNTVGPVVINMPCATGIVVAPGSGQVVALSYA